MAARFFAPKAGYIYTEGTKAVISAANETLENQSLTVTVRIRDVELIFSDNCFDLTSEETKTICIRKEDVLSGKVLSADNVRKTLKIRSLRDTYEQ